MNDFDKYFWDLFTRNISFKDYLDSTLGPDFLSNVIIDKRNEQINLILDEEV